MEMPVDAIAQADVLSVLKPIWNGKRETAGRVKQRISAVMQWAIAQGHRADNPVDAVSAALPRHRQAAEHHRALPFAQVSNALQAVRESKAALAVKLAFEFLVLTAARSGEVRGATWAEINLRDGVWEIPAERMKAGAAHAVPLSEAALDVLEQAAQAFGNAGLIFPSSKAGRELTDNALSRTLRTLGVQAVPHGFRSSFRDWCAESGFERDIAEAALAHSVRNAVEAAYRRTDFLAKRADMMQRWADFVRPNA